MMQAAVRLIRLNGPAVIGVAVPLSVKSDAVQLLCDGACASCHSTCAQLQMRQYLVLVYAVGHV
jgi:predicted phosphoribosyltransferase